MRRLSLLLVLVLSLAVLVASPVSADPVPADETVIIAVPQGVDFNVGDGDIDMFCRRN